MIIYCRLPKATPIGEKGEIVRLELSDEVYTVRTTSYYLHYDYPWQLDAGEKVRIILNADPQAHRSWVIITPIKELRWLGTRRDNLILSPD